ncbi:MAG: GNAT family N-acetyltransferase [Enterococcaceae bacterium]|nr:GNAT family N-acetyltransferase [Enterococcaceae bacterium]MCI1919467.1 GNAT family N-acetyltransferase [Enterococcaceae bacterium]
MIHYENKLDLPQEEVLALYESIGWKFYTKDPAALLAGIKNSLAVVTAWEGDRLVGLIRAVGDGHTVLLIQDLLVDPAFQSRGIAFRLMTKVLALYAEVPQIFLATPSDRGAVKFYESCGFRETNPTDEFQVVKLIHHR